MTGRLRGGSAGKELATTNTVCVVLFVYTVANPQLRCHKRSHWQTGAL